MNQDPAQAAEIIWLNGSFMPLGKACISPLDRGFLYGDGVFETMRAEEGRILCLEAHLARLRRTLSALRIASNDGSNWGNAARELLDRNRLLEDSAAVKILVTRGVTDSPGLPAPRHPTVCITVRKYSPPSRDVYRRGWRLHVFRDGFSPPLAHHKTLNYLYFLQARQAALQANADEAVVLDPFGRVTETSAGSLLARTGGSWWIPSSPHKLPGVTVGYISELFRLSGMPVHDKECRPSDFEKAETVWVVNSLMGIMPVREIDDIHLPQPAEEDASFWRSAYLGKVDHPANFHEPSVHNQL